MKKFYLMTIVFCLFSCLATLCFLTCLAIPFVNTFGDFIFPIWFIGVYVIICIVHDYICRYAVCSVRKKHNICDGCYFWNCPHYSVCPYNSNK